MSTANGKARFWIGTVWLDSAGSYRLNQLIATGNLESPLCYLRGQTETCPTTGKAHYQVVAGFNRQMRLRAVKSACGEGHWEPTKSAAVDAYVWKDASSVPGSRFEFGEKAIRRNVEADWDKVKELAITGRINEVPSDIFIRFIIRINSRYYNGLKAIASDNEPVVGIEKEVNVYWGKTATGKSHKAWEEAGNDAYSKDPRTKWWDGYKGQKHVVIDEFRGTIDISHILRWFDKYPVRIETKGSSRPLQATKIWITSNLSPEMWYPELDIETRDALKRRLKVTHFN